ncbi:MAG TPA: NAD(P)H-dependent oxidoreductase [Xanthobacteraceae bacterium]|jgi:NAD(P)H dehydrogenase (quinone)|nr:NAD(P)H-dependent oxidoreductase [Xanthobacteraceae bacterium]
MRVHYLYCHPEATSFHAAIRARALAGLAAARHEVDLLDLYADKFDPVMWEAERRDYHDTSRNQARLADYIARLRAAEALIVQFPVWSFGMPAMLKGYFDRIMMPGVAFDLSNPARSRPLLGNLRRIAGIATYGRPRIRAVAIGDPPRKMVTRYLPWFANWRSRVDYYALYHMNVATDAERAAFIDKVERAMSRF